MKTSRRTLAALLIAVLAAPLPARAQAAGPGVEEEFRTHFRAGVDAYKRGKFQEAFEAIEKALQLHVADDLVLAMREEAGTALVLQMAQEKGPLRDTAIRILEYSKRGSELIRRDEAKIKEYVEQLRSDKFDDVQIAIFHLASIGGYAAPQLLPVLADSREDRFRTNAILALTRMGGEAVLPVIEALNARDPFLRQNAAITLGHIKDERAIPELKRVWENPDERPEVKKYAAEALMKITGKDPTDLKTAKEYYFIYAEKYYYSHPSVIRSLYRDWVVWRWSDEQQAVTMREVPAFAFNEEMAEECCYDAILIDPSYEPTWPLLASVFLAQVNESEVAVRNGEDKLKVNQISQEALDRLKAALKDADRAAVLSNLVGKASLYRALRRALEDDNPLVAVSAIRQIREQGRWEDVPSAAGDAAATAATTSAPAPSAATPGTAGAAPSARIEGAPLVDALTHGDKRVRYAAAEAFVRMNPQQPHLGADLVIPNLVDALGESGVRVALIIYDESTPEDKQFLYDLRKKLTSFNAFPVTARSGVEGIAKAKSFPTEDVILVRSTIANQVSFQVKANATQVVESVFDTLKADVRTRSMPVYLLCGDDEDVRAQKQVYEDKVDTYLAKGRDGMIDKLLLRDALDKTFDLPEAQKDFKGRADQISAEAARALASIVVTNTIYPYFDAVPGLIKALDPDLRREDFIRMPVMEALGVFADPKAVDVLAKTLAKKDENSAEIRAAAAKALARIFRKNEGLAPSNEVFDVLKDNLREGNAPVELNCGEALGAAALSPEQRRDLELFRRMHAVK